MIEDIALDVQIGAIVDLDSEAIPEGRDQSLLDHRQPLAMWTFHLHTVLDPQHPLLYLAQYGAMTIFEEECFPHAQGLAIDFEGAFALRVFDPEVIADGEDFLTHSIAGRAAAMTKNPAFLLPTLTSSFKQHF